MTTTQFPENGAKRKGRKVPELPTFVFPVSGYEVKIRRLGPFTMNEIRMGILRERRAPEAPLVKVEDGEDAQGNLLYRTEVNEADPEYRKALDEYEEWVRMEAGTRFLKIMFDYCVMLDDYTEEEIAELANEKRTLLAAVGAMSEEVAQMSDRDVFTRHVLINHEDDLTSLQRFVMSRSQPTEEAVQAHIATFPGAVQG